MAVATVTADNNLRYLHRKVIHIVSSNGKREWQMTMCVCMSVPVSLSQIVILCNMNAMHERLLSEDKAHTHRTCMQRRQT